MKPIQICHVNHIQYSQHSKHNKLCQAHNHNRSSRWAEISSWHCRRVANSRKASIRLRLVNRIDHVRQVERHIRVTPWTTCWKAKRHPFQRESPICTRKSKVSTLTSSNWLASSWCHPKTPLSLHSSQMPTRLQPTRLPRTISNHRPNWDQVEPSMKHLLMDIRRYRSPKTHPKRNLCSDRWLKTNE